MVDRAFFCYENLRNCVYVVVDRSFTRRKKRASGSSRAKKVRESVNRSSLFYLETTMYIREPREGIHLYTSNRSGLERLFETRAAFSISS